MDINFIELLFEHIEVLEEEVQLLSRIIILLYTGDASDGVASPLLVVLGDPPAMLLFILSILTLFSFAAGIEIAKDSSAQFQIAAGEAPSTLSTLAAYVSPRREH